MCHYITMVVGRVSEADLDAFMQTRGRQAKLVFNPSVQKALAPDELHFLTSKGPCDCGTVLDRRGRGETERSGSTAEKLKAKGWSQAKIDRWLAEKDKSKAKQPRASSVDSVEFWSALVRDLRRELSPTSVGLLLHFYSGWVGSEKFAVLRAEGDGFPSIEEALAAMREDELMILPRAG